MNRGRFRRVYGASPLHLFALVAAFAFIGYAALSWFQLGFGAVVRWLLIALIGHDLVLLPLYTLLDWIAFGHERGRARAARPGVSAVPFVRVPALLSGLLLLVFAPEILSLGTGYLSQTGLAEHVYLKRWVVATGIMFALSGLAYAVALRRARSADTRINSQRAVWDGVRRKARARPANPAPSDGGGGASRR